MAWDGWWEYGGSEFINTQRTAKYVKATPWFRCPPCTSDLALMLGDREYSSPLQDDPPWADPHRPESYGFYGLWPLDVSGIDDSSRTGTVIESIGDGGVVGRVRHATKAVVFNTLLLARDDCGADYGIRWLRQLLLGSACGPRATAVCSGEDLCYLSCCPTLDWSGEDHIPLTDCLPPYLRSLRQVVFNNGPTVMSKAEASDGAAIWSVQFTAVAGNPFEFGSEVPIIEGFLNPTVTNPYLIDPPGVMDTNPKVFDEVTCVAPTWQPVVNPKCPDVIMPPGPPTIKIGCYQAPANWNRRQFTIPKEQIPLWGEVVPKIEVHATTGDVENLRLRFYADVEGDGDVSQDPCAYCGDIVFSYVPSGTTMVLDASDQITYVLSQGGERQRADGLVYKTDGTPLEWPVLTCGMGYVVTVDLPQIGPVPTVDLSLYPRAV
jgi:hypothetical protein